MNFFHELDLIGSDKSHETITESLKINKLLKIKGVEDNFSSFYKSFVDSLGRDPSGWIQVKHSSEKVNYNRPRPFHTDEAYFTKYGEICLMYCVEKANRGGGGMLYLDANDLYSHLEEKHGNLMKSLQSESFSFEKGDQKRVSRILWKENNTVKVNWNYNSLFKNNTNNLLLIEQFNTLLNEFIDKNKHLLKHCDLMPGEAIIWHDSLVIHGRESVSGTESENNRYYRKISFKF